MIRITADTLEEAYTKASKELGVSVVDLELEILQAPSKGIFGLFKKPAIITAVNKNSSDKKSSDEYIEIENGIKKLMSDSCFDLQLIDLKIDDESVNITLDGKDAALLIGKEGYRYKALSYMLHNWIKIKYDKDITLEIAQFLKNQNEMIDRYIEILKQRIDEQGYAQTKPLDGILIKIALTKLRELYPNKYVAIRTLKDGRKKVIVNEYKGERR